MFSSFCVIVLLLVQKANIPDNGGDITMSSNYAPIPIINRMTSILDKVLTSPSGVSTTELLRSEDIPKTTLYRLLASMTVNEYLSYSSETGTYILGNKFTTTYVSLDERVFRLREAALPFLRRLADEVQETVKLTVLSGMQSYTVASFEGSRPLRISIATGAIFPLHAGASGKVLMCTLSSSAVRQYYAFYGKAYTDNTIMSIEEMEKELAQIRAQGYATDNGEYMPEIKAIAVPVYDASRQIIASISISYPSTYQDHIDCQHLIAQAAQTAQQISTALVTQNHHAPLAQLINHNTIY